MTKLTRRDVLKVGTAAAAAGASVIAASRGRLPGLQGAEAGAAGETWVKTTCAMCPSGCGLEVRVVGGKAVKIEGNALHPLNQGVCCLKGQTALEALYSPERIRHPRLQTGARGSGDWKEISWDEALGLVAGRLSELRQKGQAHRMAFLHGETRGQMRSLIQRFMQAYGSPNMIAAQHSPARLAMWLTQGINGIPVYDLNNSRYVMAFGGNLLESNRHVIGYLGSLAFMRRGRPQRGKLVVAHPRLGITGMKADEWVPIRPGTYAALALGMANVIINSQMYDAGFIENFTFGFEDFTDESGQLHKGFKRLVLEGYPLERVARITGVSTEIIARLAGEFATNLPAVALMPTEEEALASGNSLYTAMAIHCLNALVGSIDCPGGVLVQRFPEMAEWPEFSPDAAGQSGLAQPRVDEAGTADLPLAVSAPLNLAKAIESGSPYPLDTLFVYNANPVYDLPNGSQFARSLMKVPFVVSLANTLDETSAHTDLILPVGTFLEEWGDDFIEGTGYAGVSLRRPVVEPVHDTLPAGELLLELARRLGGPAAQALPWKSYLDLVKHRLSAIDMEWEKLEANGAWSEMVYFNATPGSPAWGDVVGRDRLHAPQDGRFDFFSRELHALLAAQPGGQSDEACLPHFVLPATLAEDTREMEQYPFLLVSQSLFTQSTTWNGIIPSLQEAYGLQFHDQWKSWVEINPRAARQLGLEEGDLVWVESAYGRVQASVRLYEGLWPNAVFLPPGQGRLTAVRWGRGAPQRMQVGVNSNQLLNAGSEPLTGQPAFNPTRVRVYKAE